MRSDYDWSEAEDIYNILKCLGVVKVVDVGCGGGELVEFLRSRDFEAVGCDTAVTSSTTTMFYCDATKPETVPTAEAWVLQHVLEHIPKDSWSQLFERAWKTFLLPFGSFLYTAIPSYRVAEHTAFLLPFGSFGVVYVMEPHPMSLENIKLSTPFWEFQLCRLFTFQCIDLGFLLPFGSFASTWLR
jgi:hypothetical protein